MPRLIEIRAPKFRGPSLNDPTQVEVTVARNVYSPKIGSVGKRPGFARQQQSQFQGPVSLLALPSGVCGYIREGLLMISGEVGDWDPAGSTPWGGAAGGNGGIVLESVPSVPADPEQPTAPAEYPNDNFNRVSLGSAWGVTDPTLQIANNRLYLTTGGVDSIGKMEWADVPNSAQSILTIQFDVGGVYRGGTPTKVSGHYLHVWRGSDDLYVLYSMHLSEDKMILYAGATPGSFSFVEIAPAPQGTGVMRMEITNAHVKAYFIPSGGPTYSVQHNSASSGPYTKYEWRLYDTQLGSDVYIDNVETSY